LQVRERPLRTILDTIPGVVVHLDSKLRIKFANKAFETMADCRCFELIGRDIRHALPSGNPIAGQMPRIVEDLSGSAATSEVEFVSETGQQRWMAVLQIPDVGMQREVQGYIVARDRMRVLAMRQVAALTMGCVDALTQWGQIVGVQRMTQTYPTLDGGCHQ